MLTLGSLFDGIGGWLDAAVRAGVKPVWASEIEPFPCAVTAHHYPDVKQLGDITKIDVDKLEPVDIVCAGSPCQDLSVAGKREGLAGERSGLFRTAVELVHRLRDRTGLPRYFVWENVLGAFSSNKGFDFKAVLEEITKTEIPMPRDNKWAEAGMVEWGGTSSLAWRTLDAQYWGVPQRRKRIFLVADFGGFTAGEILFVESGLSGDSSQSKNEGQGTSTAVEGSIREASLLRMRSGCEGGGKGPLVSENKSLTLATNNDQVLFDTTKDTVAYGLDQQGGKGMAGYTFEKCPTMASDSHGTPHAVAQVFPQQAYDKWDEGLPMTTLKATGGTYGGGSDSLILTPSQTNTDENKSPLGGDK